MYLLSQRSPIFFLKYLSKTSTKTVGVIIFTELYMTEQGFGLAFQMNTIH